MFSKVLDLQWYIIKLTNQRLLDQIPMDTAFLLMEIFGHH